MKSNSPRFRDSLESYIVDLFPNAVNVKGDHGT